MGSGKRWKGASYVDSCSLRGAAPAAHHPGCGTRGGARYRVHRGGVQRGRPSHRSGGAGRHRGDVAARPALPRCLPCHERRRAGWQHAAVLRAARARGSAHRSRARTCSERGVHGSRHSRCRQHLARPRDGSCHVHSLVVRGQGVPRSGERAGVPGGAHRAFGPFVRDASAGRAHRGARGSDARSTCGVRGKRRPFAQAEGRRPVRVRAGRPAVRRAHCRTILDRRAGGPVRLRRAVLRPGGGVRPALIPNHGRRAGGGGAGARRSGQRR